MLKKIKKKYGLGNKASEIIYQAWCEGLCNLINIPNLEEELNLLEDVELDSKQLYEKFIERLEEEGITSRRLRALNGYVTISYSKSLGNYLQSFIKKHDFDTIAEVVSIAYKNLIKNAIKTPTLLTFFKDEKGSGIGYYLDEYISERDPDK